MNSCLLKHPIDIYELQTTKTPYGNTKDEYILKYSTRAYIKFNSESLVKSEGEILHPISRTFIVRAYVPVVETDRIFWGDKWWKIISINQNIYFNDQEIIVTEVNK